MQTRNFEENIKKSIPETVFQAAKLLLEKEFDSEGKPNTDLLELQKIPALDDFKTDIIKEVSFLSVYEKDIKSFPLPERKERE